MRGLDAGTSHLSTNALVSPHHHMTSRQARRRRGAPPRPPHHHHTHTDTHLLPSVARVAVLVPLLADLARVARLAALAVLCTGPHHRRRLVMNCGPNLMIKVCIQWLVGERAVSSQEAHQPRSDQTAAPHLECYTLETHHNDAHASIPRPHCALHTQHTCCTRTVRRPALPPHLPRVR